MGGQERHIPPEEGSFIDEHGNTIKPDIAGCYMCTGYGDNSDIKQLTAI
jgi:hypothetical protein